MNSGGFHRLILVLVIQILVVLGLLEILGRLFDPMGISYYPETARFLDTMIQEEPIGYRNRPGVDGLYYGARVEINSLGLREPEIPTVKPDGERRLLLLGDSFTFGIATEYKETISYQLQAIWENAAGQEKKSPVRVVNMGVVSYNTEQELFQLQTLGEQLKPDMVVLLYSVNDIESKMWVFEKRASWFASLGQRSYAISLIYKVYRMLQSLSDDANFGVNVGNYQEGHPRWETVESSLRKIKEFCDSMEIPFVMFTTLKKSHAAWSLLEDVARLNGFPLVNLYAWDDPRWMDENPKDYIAPGGGLHPNAEGNFIYATLIREALDELGYYLR